MFCIILLAILQKTFSETNKGIIIGGEPHTDKGYADVVGIIASSVKELNEILDRLHDNAALFGLKINIDKTKVMLLGNHANNVVPNIKSVQLDTVKQFEYLRRILSYDANDTDALVHQIGKAWGAFEKKKT